MAAREKKPDADVRLAPEQFPEQNAQFYREIGPHTYLMQRLRAAVLAGVEPDQLPEAFDREFRVGNLKATWTRDEEDEDPARRSAFLSAETTILVHNAAESLVRLFLAHKNVPPCPWLEVSRRYRFKPRLVELKQELRRSQAASDAMLVFFGRSTRDSSAEVTEEQWEATSRGIVLLLTIAVGLLLEDGGIYNAAKHGLAIVPANASIALGDPEAPFLGAEGPSLMHLEAVEAAERWRWQTTTTWVRADRNLSLVMVMARQIENLWNVAKWRYVDQKHRYQMHGISEEFMREVHRGGEEQKTYTVPHFSMAWLYYRDDVDATD